MPAYWALYRLEDAVAVWAWPVLVGVLVVSALVLLAGAAWARWGS